MEAKIYCKSRSQSLAEGDQFKPKPWDTKIKTLTTKRKQVEGRNIPYTSIEEIDNAERMQQYKVEDFKLENLMEIGAIGELTEGQVEPSTLMMIQHMETGAYKAIEQIDTEERINKYIKAYEKSKATKTKKEKED